jgi:hypothetical protein
LTTEEVVDVAGRAEGSRAKFGATGTTFPKTGAPVL